MKRTYQPSKKMSQNGHRLPQTDEHKKWKEDPCSKTTGRSSSTDSGMRWRFPKSLRLLFPHQFRRVTHYGHTASGKYLSIQICESKKSSLKLGITVSRKFGKASERISLQTACPGKYSASPNTPFPAISTLTSAPKTLSATLPCTNSKLNSSPSLSKNN